MAVTAVEILITPSLPGVDPTDPFRYGWRPVEQRRPDGGVEIVRVPLTLDDVLHPRKGDQMTHSDAHERCCVYLYDVFRAQLAADPRAVVLKDVLIAWDVDDLRPHGPDVAVIREVRARQNWSTFDVVAEGTRPALIVEVTSPETAAIDRLIKYEEYDLARVPLYLIVDLVSRRGQASPRLLAYHRGLDGYRELPPNDLGRIWLEPLGLWVGIENDAVVCYQADGSPIGDYTAQVEARAAADERIRQLEAEVRRLRGEA
jgi:Uma2 family endonuclease